MKQKFSHFQSYAVLFIILSSIHQPPAFSVNTIARVFIINSKSCFKFAS